MFEKIKTFLVEVGIEMNKVSWPIKRGANISYSERYRELSDSTIMVIASSIALAAYIGVMDITLSSLMGLLIG